MDPRSMMSPTVPTVKAAVPFLMFTVAPWARVPGFFLTVVPAVPVAPAIVVRRRRQAIRASLPALTTVILNRFTRMTDGFAVRSSTKASSVSATVFVVAAGTWTTYSGIGAQPPLLTVHVYVNWIWSPLTTLIAVKTERSQSVPAEEA